MFMTIPICSKQTSQFIYYYNLETSIFCLFNVFFGDQEYTCTYFKIAQILSLTNKSNIIKCGNTLANSQTLVLQVLHLHVQVLK